MGRKVIPAIPDSVDGVRVEGPVSIRYEDISQDGHFRPLGLPHALGALVWPALWVRPEAVLAREAGVLPILSRMILRRGEGPLSAIRPLHGRGVGHRAAVRSPTGEVDRVLLMMWARLEGALGATHQFDSAGNTIFAGEVYAEHVFTRLMAPPSERRVRELPDGIPAGNWEWTPFEAVAHPAAGWQAAEEQHHSYRFGLTHTDPNFHVNSLVYPRIFEDVALECAAQSELDCSGLGAEEIEMMWRKPFFSGERAKIRATLYRAANRLTVLGAFLDEGGAERCRIRLLFA